jgi:hypothetical protein
MFNNKELLKSFTYVKYYDGGYVPLHHDHYDGENPKFSVILYLNDNYENGETYIYKDNVKVPIVKKQGKIVIFEGSKILHGSEPVCGVKHVLIMKLCCE